MVSQFYWTGSLYFTCIEPPVLQHATFHGSASPALNRLQKCPNQPLRLNISDVKNIYIRFRVEQTIWFSARSRTATWVCSVGLSALWISTEVGAFALLMLEKPHTISKWKTHKRAEMRSRHKQTRDGSRWCDDAPCE